MEERLREVRREIADLEQRLDDLWMEELRLRDEVAVERAKRQMAHLSREDLEDGMRRGSPEDVDF